MLAKKVIPAFSIKSKVTLAVSCLTLTAVPLDSDFKSTILVGSNTKFTFDVLGTSTYSQSVQDFLINTIATSVDTSFMFLAHFNSCQLNLAIFKFLFYIKYTTIFYMPIVR